MEFDSFLSTEEFIKIFGDCWKWDNLTLREEVAKYNFTRGQALYLIHCKDIQLQLNELEQLKGQLND